MTQQANQPQGNIYMAMAAIARDIDHIAKDRKNEQQGFRFRGIDDVYNALHPIFAAHGVVCRPMVEKHNQEAAGQTKNGSIITRTTVMVRYWFTASDGSSIDSVMAGEGLDSADKGTAKALSVAYKNLLLQTFLIPTQENIDGDFYDPTVMPREELSRRREQQAKEATDKDIISQLIQQHLENADLTDSATEKSRLQGLAAELRCKLAEMEKPVLGKEIVQHAENEEPPAEKPAKPTAPKPDPAPGDWRTVDFSHKNPPLDSLLYGKTVGDIFSSEPATIARARKKFGGFMAAMDEIAKQIEAGNTVAYAPQDMRLYRAIIEAEEWLAVQSTK